MQIRQATTEAEIATARGLFQEYAAWLKVDLCFQRFEDELAGLPGLYAPPQGRLLLAWAEDQPAGCVALRPFAGSTCEMKRLFVRGQFQGRGFGSKLAEAVVEEAASIGYTRIVLDTLPSMKGALHVYKSIGFKVRTPYYETPLRETVFLELALDL